MKRDMDIIVDILRAIEDDERGIPMDGFVIPKRYDNSEIHPDYVVAYHVKLAVDDGLIEADITDFLNPELDPPQFVVKRMTSAGHEFLDLSRRDTIWEKAKKDVKDQTGGLSLEILKRTLIDLLS